MATDTNNTFLGNFVSQFLLALKPLDDSIRDLGKFQQLLLQLGWSVNNLPVAQLQPVADAIETFFDAFEDLVDEPTEADILNLLAAAGNVYVQIKNNASNIANSLSGLGPLVGQFISEFPQQLFQFLIEQYLSNHQQSLASFFKLLGIIEYQYIPGSSVRPAYTKVKFNLEDIADIVSDPLLLLKSKIGWNITNAVFEKLVNLLFNLLASTGLPTVYKRPSVSDTISYRTVFGNNDQIRNGLDIYLASLKLPTEIVPLTLSISDSVGSGIADSGLIIRLNIPNSISLNQPITDDLSLNLTLSAAIGKGLAFLVKPNGLQLKFLTDTGASFPDASFAATIKYSPDTPAIIFGKSEGTRLQVKDFSFLLGAEYAGDIEIIAEADLSGISLVIDPGQSDSFIGKILGDQPREIGFPVTIRWSSKHGISFKGSGSFEFNVNMHFKLGPIEFNDIKVSLRAPQGQNSVKADIGTNIKGDLGPVIFTVDNIGLGLTLGLHEGNAGPFDIKLGFKPPTGIGLAINAGPVTGGGFLNYDESTWTYTGGLELNFSKISFSAIGIVSTRLPGGQKGYSLLIIISAEFTPIQLGMGFTLNGIGGLLGLNRTMNPDVLRNGIRDNTLDSILFPKDIVKNANTIISNIGQAFPAREGQFLVGPMVKIGWGTPTLLTIELGIIIELPEPLRLAILGVIKALLPSKDNAIVKIQVNFLGIIDFTNKYLSFDASLYDSQILTFGLFGDMALRLYWGDKPNFLLSVGGFHPKFTPPPLNLPELRRLTIVLANQDNLKISVETYFAVTSNSVQFGAKVAAMAKAWKIQAIGALWFDILFQFRPFYFIADMGVMFAIKMGSKTILSLYVNLTLEGPNPWRARGKGSFKVLFVKVSVSFDKTFGQARIEAIQAEAIDARVKAALTNRDNWEALLPARSHELISWREENVDDPNLEISVDPAGSLKVSQKLIPLQTTMAKFGSSAISDFKRYDITSVKAGTDTLPKKVLQDNFARNEFFYMTDDEKLSRPSYELFDSGVVVGADRIDAQYAVHKQCHYEEITLDAGYRRPEPIYVLSANLFGLHRFGSYVSRSGLSDFDRITTSVGPNRVNVDLQLEEFVLIDRNNMNPVSGYFSNSAAAQQFLAAQMAGAPATAANWIVANRFEL